MEWLFIIKKCGHGKFGVLCSFLHLGVVCLLFDFLWSGGNALVLVMEQFPCCIGDGLYGHVYHIFGCWLVL